MKTYVHLLDLVHFFLKWEIFQTNVVEKRKKTHFMFNNFFPKIVPFMRYCGKILYSHGGYRWQYYACALQAGLLRLQTHTQICNSYWYSTATMVERTRLNVTLYVHCLCCYSHNFVLTYFYLKLQPSYMILSIFNTFISGICDEYC